MQKWEIWNQPRSSFSCNRLIHRNFPVRLSILNRRNPESTRATEELRSVSYSTSVLFYLIFANSIRNQFWNYVFLLGLATFEDSNSSIGRVCWVIGRSMASWLKAAEGTLALFLFDCLSRLEFDTYCTVDLSLFWNRSLIRVVHFS